MGLIKRSIVSTWTKDAEEARGLCMRGRGEIGVHLGNLGLDPGGRLSLLDKALIRHRAARRGTYESCQIQLSILMHA